jgi:hypothetical protein
VPGKSKWREKEFRFLGRGGKMAAVERNGILKVFFNEHDSRIGEAEN